MFDYDGFDPIAEEGLLRPSQVDKIRSALEDIIERLYKPCIIDEEVDLQIRKMANELDVHVPPMLEDKISKFGEEYIEDVLSSHFKMDVIYFSYPNPDDAYSRLLPSVKCFPELNERISEEDLLEFCHSLYFKVRVEEERNVL